MARVIENTAGKTRNKPIAPELKTLLVKAATQTGIDTVSVTSGGQDIKGQGTRRTGSTRHDGGKAADLQLIKGGSVLDFETDRKTFEAFVTAAAAAGATGLGAGVDYMGTKTIHVGFGSKLVWGGGGKAANAPAWLKRAAEKGWAGGAAAPAPAPTPPAPVGLGKNRVNARDGLILRGGPGQTWPKIRTLPFASKLWVVAFDTVDARWALVDLEDDGRTDGYMFAPLLAPVEDDEGS
jgi:hypothetical protein